MSGEKKLTFEMHFVLCTLIMHQNALQNVHKKCYQKMCMNNVRYKCNEKMYIKNVIKKIICNKYH